MTNKDRDKIVHKLIRAENLIQEAKQLLWSEWRNYFDVELWMSQMESMRYRTTILQDKFRNNTVR
jgi:hypothetical protein